jgi:RimJ/RimL family protein N-acetyltransferase
MSIKYPDLIGERIALRRLNVDNDVEELYAASHGENQGIWHFLFQSPFATSSDMAVFLREFVADPTTVSFCVVDLSSGKKIGMVNYINIVPEHKRLELGSLWYTPAFHRTYANTESMYMLLCHAFDTLKQRRVEWKCDNNNEPSKKAALRLGFKFEGIFRKHMIIKERNRDTAWFSIIDDEWEAAKKNLLGKLKS